MAASLVFKRLIFSVIFFWKPKKWINTEKRLNDKMKMAILSANVIFYTYG